MEDIDSLKNEIVRVDVINKVFWTEFLNVSERIQKIKESEGGVEGEADSGVMKFITQIVKDYS